MSPYSIFAWLLAATPLSWNRSLAQTRATVALAAFAMVSAVATVAEVDVLYEENFDENVLPEGWNTGGTGTPRVRVQTIAGQGDNDYWLVLDDSTDNDEYSSTIAEVSFKSKGYEWIDIEFQAYSLGDEVQSSFLGADGLAVSIDGNIIWADTSIHSESPGNNLAFTYRQRIYINYAAQGFSPTKEYTIALTFLQYDNAPAPEDGWAFDDIKVTGEPYRGMNISYPQTITEGDGHFDMAIELIPAPAEDQSITIAPADYDDIQVAYPKNQERVVFEVPIPDDELLNGQRSFYGDILTNEYDSTSFWIDLLDDEVATLSLQLPSTLRESDWSSSNNAVLNITPSPSNDVYVYLRSEPENEFNSYSVYVEAGSSSVPFSLSANNDYYAETDAEVEIWAILGESESPRYTITIEDDDTYNMTWNVYQNKFVEGATNQGELNFELGAGTREEITFTLSATPSGVIELPESFKVQANDSYAHDIEYSIPDDSLLNGTRFVTITATPVDLEGFDPVSTVLEVLDNDVASYDLSIGPYLVAGGQGELNIRALDTQGNRLQTFNATVDLFLVDENQSQTPFSLSSATFTEGVFTQTLTIDASWAGKRLLAKSSDEANGMTSDPFEVIVPLDFGVLDLVYHPLSDKLIASTGIDGLAGHLNSITEIDPYSATIGRKLAIGSGLDRLAVTQDGVYLYAGLNGSNAVQRVSLSDFSLAEKIELGHRHSSNDSYNIADILTLPNRSGDFVIVQDDISSTATFVGYYQNGVLLEQTASDGMSLANAKEADEFFAYDDSNTGYYLNRYKLVENGLETVETKRESFNTWNTDIKAQNNWIVSSRGGVINGETFKRERSFTLPDDWNDGYHYGDAIQVHEIDYDLSRAYFAFQNKLAVYDRISNQLVFQTELTGLSGNIVELVRYGSVGLALRTDQAQLIFLDSEYIVPRGEPVDLSFTLEPSTDEPKLDTDFTYTATIRNLSETEALSTRISLELNNAHTFKSIESDSNLDWDYGYGETAGLSIDIPSIPGNGEIEFEITVTPRLVKILLATLSGNSISVDPDPYNNTDRSSLNPTYQISRGEWQNVQIPARMARWVPGRNMLLVGTNSEENNELRNQVIGINPSNGKLYGAVELGGTFQSMDFSSDEKWLYVGLGSESLALKINLDTWEIDESIDLTKGTGYYNTFTASDILVVDGREDTFLVGTYSDGVVMFENGLALENSTGTYRGTQIEKSSDPSIIYAYNTSHTGFEFFKVQISDQGVTKLSEKGGLFSGFSNSMKSQGDYIFDAQGKMIQGDLMVNGGTFEISAIRDDGYWYSDAVWDVEPEIEKQRVYYNDAFSIYSYDTESFLKVRKLPVLEEGGSRSLRSVTRWGSDGFASIVSDQTLLIGRTDLVPQSKPYDIDLLVDQYTEGQALVIDELPVTISGGAFAGQGINRVLVDNQAVETDDDFANWSISLDTVLPGYGFIEVFAADNQSNQATKTIRIPTEYFIEGDSDFDGLDDNWELAYFEGQNLDQILPDEDSDGDGYLNRIEFYFGMDPNQIDSPATVSYQHLSATQLRVSIVTNRYHDDRYRCRFDKSSDCEVWSVTAMETVVLADDPTGNGLYERVKYELTIDTSNGSKTFLRFGF
ncbi:hypothetical protein [Pelagicoccus sp. SDUM812002]|uniref:hypothetical protein n=1 Tax=Pelagicoccus sp. SDUM812002 TaxID=3041266 RepID=UPI00280F8C75|nr:hypothetical protein [Pelagicoccus sp. SDUM812002]MDQ8188297.1 hypothetical protein [Pelagicoccus sp. SDUM812002]